MDPVILKNVLAILDRRFKISLAVFESMPWAVRSAEIWIITINHCVDIRFEIDTDIIIWIDDGCDTNIVLWTAKDFDVDADIDDDIDIAISWYR